MKIEGPNERELSPEEKQNLEKLKEVIRQSLADGKIFGS